MAQNVHTLIKNQYNILDPKLLTLGLKYINITLEYALDILYK